MEGLLYQLYSGFVQANKSHEARSFDLVDNLSSNAVERAVSYHENYHN